MKRAIFSVLALLLAMTAHGGSALPGTLHGLHFMSTGVVLVSTDGQRSGIPSCASTQPTRFALDATTAAGKVQLAGLLTAYAAGKPVGIIGTGVCSAYGGFRDDQLLHVVD